jgi:micrococcal nuclease
LLVTETSLRFNDRYFLLIIGLAGILVSGLGCGQNVALEVDIGTSGTRAFEEALVVRVIDGDTVELESGDRVRYLGIDTPETVHPDKPVECYGPEATERNKELVEGKMVSLLQDGPDRDGYDRLLRYVFIDGTFVNGDLVWRGYAYARSYEDPPSLYQTLVQLERSAREGERGLWQACHD